MAAQNACSNSVGWSVVAVAVESLVVEPVGPVHGLKLELIDVVPGFGGVGSVDALRLRVSDPLCKCVVLIRRR